MIPLQAQSWEPQGVGTLPNGYGLFSLSVVSEDVVWAVASDNIGNNIPNSHIIKVIKTVDGGDTWATFDITAAAGRISFDIVAFDENKAMITTQDYGNGNGKGVFMTTNGGETWENVFQDPAAGVWIRFFNEQDGIIINREIMATTNDGGMTWEIVPPENIPVLEEEEFTIINSGKSSCQVIGNHIWFSTNQGRIFRSQDKGYNWEAFDTAFGSSAYIASISFKDSLNGIALNQSSPFYKYNVTEDGGETWTNLTSEGDNGFNIVTYVPGTAGALIGLSTIASTSISSGYSTNFGESWDLIPTTGSSFSGARFIAPNIGWAVNTRVTSDDSPALFKWSGNLVKTHDVIEDSYLQIYPNPASSSILLSMDKLAGIDEGTLEIVSSTGKLVRQEKRTFTADIQQDISDLPKGVYLLRIQTDSKTLSKKFVKI